VLTSLMAGAVGWVIAYWPWRMLRGIKWGGFEVDWHLYLVPWWVPPTIVGAVAMLLWPILAAHARRISLLGGSVAIVLVSILIFPVIAICVEPAVIAPNGWPSIVEFVGVSPRVVKATLFYFFLGGGLMTVPSAAALIGLTLAAFGRWMVRMVERARTQGVSDGD
jgi:hypothetical protein